MGTRLTKIRLGAGNENSLLRLFSPKKFLTTTNATLTTIKAINQGVNVIQF